MLLERGPFVKGTGWGVSAAVGPPTPPNCAPLHIASFDGVSKLRRRAPRQEESRSSRSRRRDADPGASSLTRAPTDRLAPAPPIELVARTCAARRRAGWRRSPALSLPPACCSAPVRAALGANCRDAAEGAASQA